jgi:hypothetical protein
MGFRFGWKGFKELLSIHSHNRIDDIERVQGKGSGHTETYSTY